MQLYESGEYRSTKDWPYAISAGCVVYRLDDSQVEILLLFRKAGEFPELINDDVDSYHLPKGHMTIGETLEQTALRETAEEAGVEVKLQTYLGASLHQYTQYDIWRDKIIHYFAGQWQKDLPNMDHEHSSRVWLPIDEAIEKLSMDNPKHEDEIAKHLQDFLSLTNGQ